MLKSQKHVFWEALLVTILIFGLGVFMGVIIENWRTNKVSEMYSESDIKLLDARLQTQALQLGYVNCSDAIEKMYEFANNVYADAQIIDRYEKANTISTRIDLEHKKYDLLRTLLWLNIISLKKICEKESIHTVVYVYDYHTEDIDKKNKQIVISNYLNELKEKKGDSFILIPIAKNLEIGSLEMLLSNYKINETSIIIDEKIVISDLDSLKEIETHLKI